MVIQRWQSVLLLIVAALMGSFTFLSLGQIQMPEESLNFTTLGFEIEGIPTDGAQSGYRAHTWIFFIVSLMSAIIPLINIFLFRNLRLQKTLCLVEVLFILATVGVGCVYGYSLLSPYYVSWSSVIIMPLLAFLGDVMAYNRINSDLKLLSSADRLR